MSRAGVITITLLLASTPLLAREAEVKSNKTLTVGRWAERRLTKGQQALTKGDFKEALELMKDMQEDIELNALEKALMWRIIGYAHASQQHYAEAASAFEKSLALEAVPDEMGLAMQFDLGQAYLALQKHAEAANAVERWLQKTKSPTPRSYYMLGLALAQSNQPERALPWAEKAAAGPKPEEPNLFLLASVSIELQKWDVAARTLETMVVAYPKKEYWKQLVAVYQEMGDEAKRLSALERAHAAGALDDPRFILSLSHLWMKGKAADKAVRALEDAFSDGTIKSTDRDALDMISQAYFMIGDTQKGFERLEQLAPLSEDGEIYLQLSQQYLDANQPAKAGAAAARALEKGKLAEPGQAHMLIGQAFFAQGKLDEARTAFESARGFDSFRRESLTWLRKVDAAKKAAAKKPAPKNKK